MITLLKRSYSRLKSIRKTFIESVDSNYNNLDALKSINVLIVDNLDMSKSINALIINIDAFVIIVT